MARKIEIELTSERDDDTWTWRAAGAKQPKGVVDAKLLYEGARVGDVVRAEAEFEIDGITVIAVTPPPTAPRRRVRTVDVIGPPREQHGGVTSSLVPRSDRPRRDRDGDRRERPPRRDGERPARPPRSERAPRPDRGPRPERPARPEPAAKPKPKRLSPANVHRAAVVESLPPEHRPIAEQVLRGGIPAVRQAVEQQNAALQAGGQPPVKAEPFIAVAETLLPRLKAADWRDRAEAAVKDVDEISIRDLRSVVTGADAVARDDETRALATTLREALDRRLATMREEWVADIRTCMADGRLVRALRVAARPPDITAKFPAELAVEMSEAAGTAMAPDTPPDRWAVLLDAVAASPVRRTVKPAGLPAEPGDQLLHAARQASGRIPALAKLLGIAVPPPPGPPRRPPKPRPVPAPPPPVNETDVPAAPASTSE